MRPLAAIAACMGALAVLAAGCGSGGSETTGETGANETSSGATTSATPSHPEAPIGSRATPCGGAGAAAELRVVGVGCGLGRQVASGWFKDDACIPGTGASRSSCTLGKFRCLGAVADRGVTVFCVAPERSVVFIAKPPEAQ